jgi:HEAT repeat protein
MFASLKRWWHRRKLRGDAPARLSAARGLGRVGGSAVLPDLLGLLLDEDPAVRRGAAEAVEAALPDWRRSDAARQAVAAFADRLRQGPDQARAVDALVIARTPQAYAALWEALLGLDGKLDPLVRAALDRLDPGWRRSDEARRALPALAAALRDPSDGRALAAVRLLRDLGAAEAAPALVPLLIHASAAVRDEALAALDQIARTPQADAALWEALLRLDSGFPLVRGALDRLDPGWRRSDEARRALPALAAALRDPSEGRALAAVGLLRDLGAEQAAPALVPLLVHASAAVRDAALAALDELAPSWPRTAVDEAALEAFARALTLGNPLAGRARELLARVGRPESVGHLLRLPVGASQEAAGVVGTTLDQLFPAWPRSPAALGMLRDLLGAERIDRLPFWAARVVQECPADEQHFPLLLRALGLAWGRGDLDLWGLARQAFRRPGQAAACVRLLQASGPPFVRDVAAEALGQPAIAGPQERAGVVQALLAALADPDRFVRYAAAQSLGRGGYREAAPALAAVLQRLLDQRRDGQLREAAARALGELGEPSATAVLCEVVARDDHRPAQIAAAVALRRTAGAEAFLLEMICRGASFLHPYCHDLLAAHADHVPGSVLSRADWDRRAWVSVVERLDFNRLADEFRQTSRNGTEINSVALLTTVRQRLFDAGRDLEEFLAHLRRRWGLREARDLADSWGVGGFWRPD